MGLGVRRFAVDRIKPIKGETPNEVSNALFVKEASAGRLFGVYEQIFFFGTLAVGQPGGIAVWLAFKVAAKWASWQHIMRLPEALGEKSLGLSHAIRSRNVWGSVILTRFLIGTLYNLLAAGVGFSVFALCKRSLRDLCGLPII